MKKVMLMMVGFAAVAVMAGCCCSAKADCEKKSCAKTECTQVKQCSKQAGKCNSQKKCAKCVKTGKCAKANCAKTNCAK